MTDTTPIRVVEELVHATAEDRIRWGVCDDSYVAKVGNTYLCFVPDKMLKVDWFKLEYDHPAAVFFPMLQHEIKESGTRIFNEIISYLDSL